jgi:hypothetical protein
MKMKRKDGIPEKLKALSTSPPNLQKKTKKARTDK